MALSFGNGSYTQTTMPGQQKPSFGKPPGSSQENYLTKQPAGQAQSTPSPSQGTPYAAYAPNSSSSYATNTDGVNRTYNTNTYNNADAGNFANNPASRPPPFTQGATGLGGQKFSDPSQAFVQRDAMIDRLNNSKSKYTANAGVYQGDGPPPASFGQRPQYDFNSLMGQANDMVQQGWANPFSQGSGGSDTGGTRKGGGPSPSASYSPGAGGSGGQAPAYGHQIMTGQSGAAYYPGGPGGFPAQPPPAGGQTVTNYTTPGGGQATSTVNFGPVGSPPPSPARPQPAPPPVFGSGFLEGSQGQHYPGRPLGFGGRPPGFGQQPAPQAPAGDAISPYADSQGRQAYISTAGNRPPSDNNYGRGFGPGVPILKGPGPQRPGNAQPIAQPPQGTPYTPAGGPRPTPGNGGVYEQDGNTYFPINAAGPPPPAPPSFEWVKSARNQQSPLVLKRIDPATQPAQPAAGYPGFDPRTQAPSGQPLRPGNAQPIAQPPQGTPYRQPPSQPQYGTPPDRRGEPRTADWRDGDRDGVDDRDQDGPGMPGYGPPPQTGIRHWTDNPAYAPVERPPPRRTGTANYQTRRRR
jgi:hypothetical protein